MPREARFARFGTPAVVIVFAALTLALSVVRFLNNDEVEHLHSAWLVFSGRVPYLDFFQLHHPLLWFCLAPALAVTGESASTIIVFRVACFALAVAVLRATFRLAIACRASRDAAWLAAALLAAMTTFAYRAIEIRPDVPQTYCGVLAVIALVRLQDTRAARDAARAGAFAALAVLFLQKAALLLAFFPVVFGVVAWRACWPRRAVLRAAAAFAGAFAAVCLPFALYLAATGSLEAYFVANWLLVPHVPAGRARYSFLAPAMIRDFLRNGVFWALVLAMAASLARRRLVADHAIPAALGLGTVAALFALNRVADRDLLAGLPFLAVAAAAWLSGVFEARRVRPSGALAVLLVVCLVPAISMVRALGRSNQAQLARIQYVLDRSRPDERMFDPWRDYNLFRPDVHYFWFHTGSIADHYRRLAGGRYAGYEVCDLLAAERPPFVSDRRGDLARCGLAGAYRPTPFGRFFERAGR